MTKNPSPLDVEADRRAFLGTAAGVVVPPAMVMLLSTSMASSAIAASGGEIGGGGGHSDVNPFPALFGFPAAGAVASQAAGAAPMVLAAAPVAAAAAPLETASSSSAIPVVVPPVLPGHAPIVPVALGPRSAAPPMIVAGTNRTPSQRILAMRRAGERG